MMMYKLLLLEEIPECIYRQQSCSVHALLFYDDTAVWYGEEISEINNCRYFHNALVYERINNTLLYQIMHFTSARKLFSQLRLTGKNFLVSVY